MVTAHPGSDAARSTVPSYALEPGTRLVGRYRLEELLDDTGGTDRLWSASGDTTSDALAGTSSWRAVDEILSRPVNVRTLAADTGRADLVLAAAQASARAHDHRFLRVLDASTDGGVVRYDRLNQRDAKRFDFRRARAIVRLIGVQIGVELRRGQFAESYRCRHTVDLHAAGSSNR